MDWDKLRIFHAVASAGSFTHAGQMLTLSQSAVSRQISALEEEISTPLFQRHARGLTLTDEGELLYGAVSDVLARLAAAEEALKNIHDSPRGSLKSF
jgi:DNA-binding transcriptional LysR family regulator